MTCPDPETLAAFSRGTLASGEQAQLEAHLDQCESCGQVVADLVRVYATQSGDPSPLPPSPQPSEMEASDTLADDELPARKRAPSLGPGARLDRYHILEPVGAGGMGVVYAAYDPDLDRKVALKVLHERGTADQRAQRRLAREAQAMARLSHPNVITVHEVRAVDGRVFISMEFAEGGTLKQWIDRERPGWERVLAMFRAIGQGLAAAHAAGLVHRDVKPENVLIGADDRPRVTDFGLARTSDDDDGSRGHSGLGSNGGITDPGFISELAPAPALDATLTRTGAMVGTPAYMAPEQFRREPVTPASDQFSFCVALYEALYGHRPFVGRSLPELAGNVLTESVRDPPRDANVPRWLRQVVRRGLAQEADNRWPSMNVLLQQLEPVSRPPLRRVALAGVLVAGVVGALVATRGGSAEACTQGQRTMDALWAQGQRKALQAALSEGASEHAQQTAALAVGRIDTYAAQWVEGHQNACEMHQRQEQSDEAFDLRGACLEQRKQELTALLSVLVEAGPAAREHAVEAIEALRPLQPCRDVKVLRARVPPPGDPAMLARVQQIERSLARARAHLYAGQYDDGLRIASQATQDAEQSGYPPLVARALHLEASLQVRRADYDAAAELFEAAWQSALGAGDDVAATESIIEFIEVLGYWHQKTGQASRRVGDATAMLERVRRFDEHLAWELEGDLFATRGRIAIRDHHYDRSIRLYEQALERAELRTGSDGLEVAELLGAIGSAYAAKHTWPRALDAYQRALDIRTERLGPAHPQTANSLNNLALVYKHLRRYDESVESFERALALAKQSLDPEHPSIRMIEVNLAEALNAARRYAEAAVYYDRHYADITTEDIDDKFILRRVMHYGQSLIRSGRYADGRRMVTLSLEHAEELGELGNVHSAMADLARIDTLEGDPERALQRLDELSKMGVSVRFAAEVARLRALALLERGLPGDPEQAERLLPAIDAAVQEYGYPYPDEVQLLRDRLEHSRPAQKP